MATMNGSLNARQRKSLADQIDRLDTILDGLAEALNGAVAEAVKEAVGVAVKEAVQAVFWEVLTNPQVARTVAQAHGLPSQPKRSLKARLADCWTRVLSSVSAATSWAVGKVKGVVRLAGRKGKAAVSNAAGCLSGLRAALYVATAFAGLTRRRIVLAAGVGLLVGVGCYLAGPLVASLVSGLAASVGSVAAGLLKPLWPLIGPTGRPQQV